MFWFLFLSLIVIEVAVTTHFYNEVKNMKNDINDMKIAQTNIAKEVGNLNNTVNGIINNTQENEDETPPVNNTEKKSNTPTPSKQETEQEKKIAAAKNFKDISGKHIALFQQDLYRDYAKTRSPAEVAKIFNVAERDVREILKISQEAIGTYSM